MRGGSISIRFGTNDIRDMSDGVFPVEVWRCSTAPGRDPSASLWFTVKKETRLKRAVNAAASGSTFGTTAEWVEIRTPADRAPVSVT